MERIALYPGSFDPVTVGHVDIAERACSLFDRVIVAVLRSPTKPGWLPVEERVRLLEMSLAHQPQITVMAFEGLTTDLAVREGACAMIRGLRNGNDFAAEENLALVNSRLQPQLETVLLLGRPEHEMISSSAVRELAHYGKSLAGFVPPCVERELEHRITGMKL